MNEHIKELLDQCTQKEMLKPWPLVDYEKFAELIIQECINQVKLELRNMGHLLTNPPQNAGVWDGCNNIRRHFGVK